MRPNEPKSIENYVSFIKMVSEQEHLLPCDLSGVAEVVEYGVGLTITEFLSAHALSAGAGLGGRVRHSARLHFGGRTLPRA